MKKKYHIGQQTNHNRGCRMEEDHVDSSVKSGCVATSYSTLQPVEDKLDTTNIQHIHPVNIRLTTYTRHSSPSPLRLGTEMAETQHLPTNVEKVLPRENQSSPNSTRRSAKRSIPKKPLRQNRSVPYLTSVSAKIRRASPNNPEEMMSSPLGHVPSHYVTRSTVQQPSPLTLMNLQQDSKYLTRAQVKLWKQSNRSPCPQHGKVVSKEKIQAKTPTYLSTPKIPRSQLVQRMVSQATGTKPKQSVSKLYAQSKSRSPHCVASPLRDKTVPLTRAKRRLLTDKQKPTKAVSTESTKDDADTKKPKQSGIMTRMRSLAASIQDKFTRRRKKKDDGDVTNSPRMENASAEELYVELPSEQHEQQTIHLTESIESMDTSLPVSCFGSRIVKTKRGRRKEKKPTDRLKKPSNPSSTPMEMSMPSVTEKSTSSNPEDSITSASAIISLAKSSQTTPTHLMYRCPSPSTGKMTEPRFPSETKYQPTQLPTLPQSSPVSMLLNQQGSPKAALDKLDSFKVLSPSPMISVPNCDQGMPFKVTTLHPMPISSSRKSSEVSIPILKSSKPQQKPSAPQPSPSSSLLSSSSSSSPLSSVEPVAVCVLAPSGKKSPPCSVNAPANSTEKVSSEFRISVPLASLPQLSSSVMATAKLPCVSSESLEQLNFSVQPEPESGLLSSTSEFTPKELHAVDLISTASLISAAIKLPLQDQCVSSGQSDCLPNETSASVPQSLISSPDPSGDTFKDYSQPQETATTVSQLPASEVCLNAGAAQSQIDMQENNEEKPRSPSFTPSTSTIEELNFWQPSNSAEGQSCQDMPSALSQRMNYSFSTERMISEMEESFKERPSCMYEDSTFLQHRSMAIQEITRPLSVMIPDYNQSYGMTSYNSTMLTYYKHLGNFNTSFLQYGTRNPVMTQTALPRFHRTQPTISTWYSNLQADSLHWSHQTHQKTLHSHHYPDLLCHESLDNNEHSSQSTTCKESMTQTNLSIPSDSSLPVLSMSDLVEGGIDLASTKKIPPTEESSGVVKEWNVSSKPDSSESSDLSGQPSKMQRQSKKTYLVIPSVLVHQSETPLDADIHSMEKSICTSRKRLFEESVSTDASWPDMKKQKTSPTMVQQASSLLASTDRKVASPEPAWTENCSDCSRVESILEESPYTLLNNLHCKNFTSMSTRDVIKEYYDSRCFYRSRGKPHLVARDLVWRLFTVAELHGNRVNTLNSATIEAIHQTVLEKSQCGEQIWKKKCIPYVNHAIRNFFSNHFRKYWNLLGHRCDPSVC